MVRHGRLALRQVSGLANESLQLTEARNAHRGGMDHALASAAELWR
ncbi:hypothetical protein H6G00_33865 [Leptolyngbya sp. FACHB-541]|nr:hypothetical protein [Leptolyngbya sp. FACHB-541]MBD2001526.1 hypothetical protein [Leptolyngbya sp. FACHB-541]